MKRTIIFGVLAFVFVFAALTTFSLTRNVDNSKTKVEIITEAEIFFIDSLCSGVGINIYAVDFDSFDSVSNFLAEVYENTTSGEIDPVAANMIEIYAGASYRGIRSLGI